MTTAIEPRVRQRPGRQHGRTCLTRMRAPQQPREPLTPENAPGRYEQLVTRLIGWSSRPVPEDWHEDFAQDIRVKLIEKRVFERAKVASNDCTNTPVFLAYVTRAVYRNSLNWMRGYRRKTGRHIATDPSCELLDGIDSRTLDLGGHDFWLDFHQSFPEVAEETVGRMWFDKAYWSSVLPRRDRCRMAKFLDQYDIAPPF